MTFTFDIYQTLVLAVAALMLGSFIQKRISILERFCIPAPVIGGLFFAIFSCILYVNGIAELIYDETVRDVCMVFFFTCIGFQADLKTLKDGGKSLVLLSLCVAILIVAQNGISIGISKLFGIDPLIGLCTGSIPMVGGHGTSGAFGPVLEEVGLEGATTFCIAAATFGLVAGGLIGGPIGEGLIQKKKLQKSESFDANPVATGKTKSSFENLASAAFQLIIAAGIGTVVLWLLSRIGLKFPIYIGAMIVASVMRNGSEFTGKFKVPMKEMNAMCGIFLNLFLGIAMLSLKLWLLSGLALPLMILLAGQTVFMIFYARYVVFSMMGRNYDAAVICGGICGLGLGATPTAMANMESICKQYGPSVNAFLIVPVVGGVILDFINSILIAFFINIIG